LLRDWRLAVTSAFLSAYRESTLTLASVPHDPGAMQKLVGLFTLEKALYEVRYELDNRPDWLYVPVEALAELAGSMSNEAAESEAANEQ
jgi:maltose alpha-D-glucosyltransferase/alpha-amylase